MLELAPKHWRGTRAKLNPAELDSPLSAFEIPPAVVATATAELTAAAASDPRTGRARGLTPGNVGSAWRLHIERARTNPTVASLIGIARALKVPLSELFEHGGEKDPAEPTSPRRKSAGRRARRFR